MAQTIKLKRSSVSGRVPTTSDLELGEVAINTYDGKMYIKKSVGGTETVVSVGGGALATSFTLYEYTASASQTTFSGSDSNSNTLAYDTGTPPKILVYLNGVLLDHSTDYTATNGTSVVLTSAAAASDLVQIAAYKSTVTSDQNLDLDDNQKILLGDDDDLQIYHDGSHSYIDDAGTGNLRIRAGNLQLQRLDGTQNYLAANTGAEVVLYYAGNKKFETSNDGVTVTGDVEATGEIIGDLRGATLFKAQAGEALTKGEVVYISGVSGNTTVVSKADADDANKMPAFGLVAASASSGNPVDIYTAGILADIDTSSFSEGDELFVSTTAGALTATAPTGESAALQKIGKVTRSDATGGRIFIIGAGRTNAVPNLNEGKLFVGNSSNQAVADNTVHVDIANSRVGIGTTSPNYKLDVASTGGGINISGSGAFLRWNSGDIQIKNEGSYKMGFYTYNSSDAALNRHMVIDTNGYVGIGTASPAVELDVKRHTNAYPLRIGSSQGEGRAIVFADVAGTPTKYNWIAGTQYNINDGFEITPSTAVGGYTFSNPALAILQDGSVGIGTTSPGHKLTISDTSGTVTRLQIDNTGNAAAGAGIYLRTLSSGTQVSNATIRTGNNGDFSIWTGTTGEGQRLTIDSVGNVGIGTTSPASLFNVYTDAGRDFRVDHGTANRTILSTDRGMIVKAGAGYSLDLDTGSANGTIRFLDNGTAHSAFDASGSLGIGTTSPSEKLTVNGNIYAISGEINVSAYKLNGTYIVDSSRNLVNIGTISSGNITTTGYLRGPSTFTIDPATHGDNTGTVVIAGNLQVDGTTTTINSTTLTVDDKNITLASGSSNAAAANGAGLTVDCGSGTDATLTYDGTNDEWDFNKNVKVSGSVGVTNIVTNKVVKFNGTILDDSTITDTGSLITLGTSTDVSGPLQFTSNVSFSSSEPGRIYKSSQHGLAFHGVAGTENNFAMFTPAGQLILTNPDGTNNALLVPAAAGARVGVATTTPYDGARMHICADDTSPSLNTTAIDDCTLILSNSDDDYGTVFATEGTGRGFIQQRRMATATYYDLCLQPYGGNVGIGTTAASARFQVEAAGIDTTTTSTTATTQVAIDTFAAATFRSARYTIQVTNSTDSTYHITEILLIHDGTTPQITEYGTIFTGSAEATFDADISSGNVRLLATPATTDSMTFKVVRHCITV